MEKVNCGLLIDNNLSNRLIRTKNDNENHTYS